VPNCVINDLPEILPRESRFQQGSKKLTSAHMAANGMARFAPPSIQSPSLAALDDIGRSSWSGTHHRFVRHGD